ncbi:hypothetical protein [Natronorubrum sulfidifaciens]|uniref:Uncharacterized protein n=1 Tax=Natronorubrum sulfidifaciens JCM 14089 TaxID=1230460 RepID=L9WDI0_9EURY|nr:hypothetical protein [Natronorubrum sulfidifaciens]ELY47341.1 hypothetical protein C495_03747 [Natronorubrum sulfidifaciens JCM 14089]
MKLKEHTVSYSRRVQLERFEPIEVSESVTVDLEEGDDLEEVSSELDDLVRENVERRVLKRVLSKKMEDDDEE